MGACGVQHLPPPAAPHPAPPLASAPEVPAPSGSGSVTIEVVNGPTQVYDLTSEALHGARDVTPMWTRPSAAPPLCVTPCSVSMPQGRYLLAFRASADPRRGGEEVLAVGPGTTHLRYALGRYDPRSEVRTAAWVALGLSYAVWQFGGGLLLLDLFPPFLGVMPGDRDSTIPVMLIVAGVAGVIASIIALVSTRPVEQPGAGSVTTSP
jgi:hypothetical protein